MSNTDKKEKEYELYPWYYEDSPLMEVPKGYYGFVYRITNLITGKMYIGRKYFYQKRKPKGKSRRVTSESDWKSYYGSCSELKDDIKLLGKEFFRRDILCLCETMGQTNYKEVEYQFKLNVLHEVDEHGQRLFYNGNILSRYFASPDLFDKEHREKISKSLKEHYKINGVSDAKKLDQSNKMKVWWSTISEQRKQEILKPLLEYAYSPSEDVKKAISEKLTGRKLSEETIQKMQGRTPWNKGMVG